MPTDQCAHVQVHHTSVNIFGHSVTGTHSPTQIRSYYGLQKHLIIVDIPYINRGICKYRKFLQSIIASDLSGWVRVSYGLTKSIGTRTCTLHILLCHPIQEKRAPPLHMHMPCHGRHDHRHVYSYHVHDILSRARLETTTAVCSRLW